MNKPHLDIMTVLRDLDPASTSVLTDEQLERADATFARIVDTPSSPTLPERPHRPRRRLARVLVPLGLVGAAGAAVPALLLGGGSAFASWTPTPEPLAGVAAAEAATTCLTLLAQPDGGEQVVLAERRGGWVYVLLAGTRSEGACLMPEALVGQEDPAAHRTEGFMGRYTSDPGETPIQARGGITAYGGSSSVPTGGLWDFARNEEWVTFVDGDVGSDVTDVTVRTPTGTDVEASVANGRFAVWWPSPVPSSDSPEVMGAWTYTVTLVDGSTREVAG